MRAAGLAGTIVSATGASALARASNAGQSVGDSPPEVVARDEFYWREIQLGFKLDRTIINLDNGGTCPTPRVALESEERFMEMINMAPTFYGGPVADRVQTIRVRMAHEFGCTPEELALTRGASEALQIVQNGIDLKAGDEVVVEVQGIGRLSNPVKAS